MKLFIIIENPRYKIDDLRILYKNLNLILETEIKKLNQYITELKLEYEQQNSKLNEIVDKTENSLQEYELLYYEINSIKKNLITKGEKISSALLKKIFKNNTPPPPLFNAIKILYIIFKNNIIDESNKNNNTSNITENNITWNILQTNFTYKTMLLLLSFISELNNITISKEITKNALSIISNYSKTKDSSGNSQEISIILDFFKLFIEYSTKLNFVKNLYESNLNKNNKMENLQVVINDLTSLIQKSKLILLEIIKDYNSFKEISLNKNKNNNIIYGYNIIEKYSLYEKYIVGQENINDYDDSYYNNYGGAHYYNNISKIKYIIKLNKKYRNKMKFIYQLSNSLISYSKGIRKINKEKFIQNIKEASLQKTRISSQKSRNTINSTNLKYSSENDYSSIDHSYRKSFANYPTRNNSGKVLMKKNQNSFIENNILLVNHGNSYNNDLEHMDRSYRTANDIASLKNSVIFQKKSKIINDKEKIKLNLENDIWSSCGLCCKNIESNFSKKK